MNKTKTKTIDKILIAAEKEFSLRGIDGAKIENIARDAGVTKQLIYHYFKTKNQLYCAILEEVSNDMKIITNLDAYTDLSPIEAIKRFINAIFDEFIKHPSYTAFTLDQALHGGKHITQASSFIPSTRTYIQKIIAPALSAGAEQKIFKPELDPEIIFWMIFHLITACFLNQKVMSETSSIDFSNSTGIQIWRESTIRFILDALAA
ncbi:MAG: TetR/AcrR family transcriptional regulator [Spongiibacteraceae bacterium]